MALAFLYLWGCGGFIAGCVELLLLLDLAECWCTAEDKIELKKGWKVNIKIYQKRLKIFQIYH